MKSLLKRLAARAAASSPVRSAVVHLVYPSIVRCLMSEIRADEPSPSGVIEALAWKAHAHAVLYDELAGGVDCCAGPPHSNTETRERLMGVALKAIESHPGDIVEFGVSSGESFLELVRRCPGRQVIGFDSFEGLPEAWWSRPKGAFAAEAPQIESPNAQLVKGWFAESVPAFFLQWRGQIALLHVDCDLYSSTSTALSHALAFCREGSVVLFDEYYNYPGFADHEWLAWRQARARLRISASCIAYDGRRAAFRIDSIRAS